MPIHQSSRYWSFKAVQMTAKESPQDRGVSRADAEAPGRSGSDDLEGNSAGVPMLHTRSEPNPGRWRFRWLLQTLVAPAAFDGSREGIGYPGYRPSAVRRCQFRRCIDNPQSHQTPDHRYWRVRDFPTKRQNRHLCHFRRLVLNSQTQKRPALKIR